MRLYIAGGCGEHGRNSFLLEEGQKGILVDCGLIHGRESSYPQLTHEKIGNINYLFLTHSHKDHTGAVKWLIQEGFNGKIIASRETYDQMLYKPDNVICLHKSSGNILLEKDLSVEYGKSGHCEGALWYIICWKQNKILFSGDYCETSEIYKCDKLRGKKVNVALLDCAYGYDETGSQNSYVEFYQEIVHWVKKDKNVLLPVPKYGRGEDIIKGLLKYEEISMVAEECLIEQCKRNKSFSRKDISELIQYNGEILNGSNVYLICDPQLEKIESRQFATQFIIRKDKIIMSGNIEEDSYSKMLYDCNAVSQKRFYVHQNLKEVRNLISQNSFDKIILTHSKVKFQTNDIKGKLIPLLTGEELFFSSSIS